MILNADSTVNAAALAYRALAHAAQVRQMFGELRDLGSTLEQNACERTLDLTAFGRVSEPLRAQAADLHARVNALEYTVRWNGDAVVPYADLRL